MDKSKITDAPNASKLLAGNLLYTLINFGSYNELLNDPDNQPSIEEHLYLHFLPFL